MKSGCEINDRFRLALLWVSGNIEIGGVQGPDSRTVTSAYGGDWKMQIFTDEISGTDHVVLSKGDITTDAPVLVRTHAINALEDILGLGPSPAAAPG